MKRLAVGAAVLFALGFLAGQLWHHAPATAEGQGGGTPSGNGDVNGDGGMNITDPIYLLTYLFLGGAPPVPIQGSQPATCALPATGQTGCYDNTGELSCSSADFPGQDSLHRAGCPTQGRFIDHGDGTVTDTCTGLMWQKSTADISGNTSVGEEDRLDWQSALKYCDGLDFAGHTDWRLPNVRELQSIVDYGRADPAIDPAFSTVAGWVFYWSSSTNAHSPEQAWAVDFFEGHVYGFSPEKAKLEAYAVRAVRDAQ